MERYPIMEELWVREGLKQDFQDLKKSKNDENACSINLQRSVFPFSFRKREKSIFT